MQKDQQKLAQLIQGKKVAFIGAGRSEEHTSELSHAR